MTDRDVLRTSFRLTPKNFCWCQIICCLASFSHTKITTRSAPCRQNARPYKPMNQQPESASKDKPTNKAAATQNVNPIVRRALGLLLALLFFAAATPTLIYGSHGLSREYAARSWPTAKAVVKAGYIVETGHRKTLWCPKWEYHYFVTPNEGYIGTTTTLGTYSCQRYRHWAEEKLRSRPVNSVIDVIYDPANPAIAALYVSDDGGLFWWLLLFCGTLSFAAGVASIHAVRKIF